MTESKHTMHLRKETSQTNRQFEEKDRNISLDETSYCMTTKGRSSLDFDFQYDYYCDYKLVCQNTSLNRDTPKIFPRRN